MRSTDLQDVYFLRKRKILEEYHWRKNAVARNALDPEFAAYLRPFIDGRPLTDPKPT